MKLANMLKKIRRRRSTSPRKLKLCNNLKNKSRILFSRLNELVLVKFTDGAFYRSVCLEVSEDKGKFGFLDYGSVYYANLTDILQFPSKMLYTCCSHKCEIKLASGRPFNDIDFDETRDLLLYKNEFFAGVAKEGKKYVVTLDDSLVAYKN